MSLSIGLEQKSANHIRTVCYVFFDAVECLLFSAGCLLLGKFWNNLENKQTWKT